MGMYGGGGGSSGTDARQLEVERQARVDAGMKNINDAFAGFDDGFYNKRAQAYEDAHMPELAQQYRTTKNSLAYALARGGISKSSAAVDKGASLQKELSNQERNLADAGLTSANELRKDVETQRSDLVNQLIASGQPSTVSAAALNSANSFKKESPVGAIGQMFDDWSKMYLANMATKAYTSTPTASAYPTYNYSGNSSRVIG